MVESQGGDEFEEAIGLSEDDDLLDHPEEVVTSAEYGDGESLTTQDILELLDQQAAILVTTSTNRNAKPEDYNRKYKRGQRKLNATLQYLGIDPPFPYDDLYEWHGRWSGGGLPTYHSRRQHVKDLGRPARDALEKALAGVQLNDPGSTGQATWAGVDARIDAVTAKLRSARSRDDFQDIGRRCREILIDAAELLADSSLVPEGFESPKKADAQQWLELLLDSQTRGSERKRFRALIRPTWALAQQVTHQGDRVETYAAAQATVLIVRTLEQLA